MSLAGENDEIESLENTFWSVFSDCVLLKLRRNPALFQLLIIII